MREIQRAEKETKKACKKRRRKEKKRKSRLYLEGGVLIKEENMSGHNLVLTREKQIKTATTENVKRGMTG